MDGKGISKPAIRNELTREIRSLSVGKDDVVRLLHILRERTDAARNIEVDNFPKLNQSDEVYEQNTNTIRESFKLQVTITGSDGSQLMGPVEDSFRTPNAPEDINSIFVSSDSTLEGAYNYHPRNFVHVFLDFSKPSIWDFSLSPSAATPNGSIIKVGGYDSTWVHGVFNEVSNFMTSHPAHMTWVHRSAVYDLLVWLAGLPFGLWVCYRLSSRLSEVGLGDSGFLLSAIYVYIVLVSLFALVVLFRYVRWVFPLVEYASSRNKAIKHRIVLGAILVGAIGTLLVDILRLIL